MPGEYQLSANWHEASWKSAPFTIRAGQTTKGVTLNCTKVYLLAGRVEIGGAPPSDWKNLHLHFERDGDSNGVRLGKGGSFTTSQAEPGKEYTVWIRRPGAMRRLELAAKYRVPERGARDVLFSF